MRNRMLLLIAALVTLGLTADAQDDEPHTRIKPLQPKLESPRSDVQSMVKTEGATVDQVRKSHPGMDIVGVWSDHPGDIVFPRHDEPPADVKDRWRPDPDAKGDNLPVNGGLRLEHVRHSSPNEDVILGGNDPSGDPYRVTLRTTNWTHFWMGTKMFRSQEAADSFVANYKRNFRRDRTDAELEEYTSHFIGKYPDPRTGVVVPWRMTETWLPPGHEVVVPEVHTRFLWAILLQKRVSDSLWENYAQKGLQILAVRACGNPVAEGQMYYSESLGSTRQKTVTLAGTDRYFPLYTPPQYNLAFNPTYNPSNVFSPTIMVSGGGGGPGWNGGPVQVGQGGQIIVSGLASFGIFSEVGSSNFTINNGSNSSSASSAASSSSSASNATGGAGGNGGNGGTGGNGGSSTVTPPTTPPNTPPGPPPISTGPPPSTIPSTPPNTPAGPPALPFPH